MNDASMNSEEPSMDRAAESEARKERLAGEAMARIKGGAHWEDWMLIGDWLAVGQQRAMRDSGVNTPFGKGFTRAFGIWLKAHPNMDGLDVRYAQHAVVGDGPPQRDRHLAQDASAKRA